MKLRENAARDIKLAIMDRYAEVVHAYDRGDYMSVVELMQNGLLTYEELVEPSKLNLEDEFWACFSSDEKDYRRPELHEVLELMQADKMGAAMEAMSEIKGKCHVSDSSTRAVFDLIEDYMNNRKEYGDD